MGQNRLLVELLQPTEPEIWTVRPDGSGLQQLTFPGIERDFTPVYSPQGDKIAFERHAADDLRSAHDHERGRRASPPSRPTRSAELGTDHLIAGSRSSKGADERAVVRTLALTLARSMSLIGRRRTRLDLSSSGSIEACRAAKASRRREVQIDEEGRSETVLVRVVLTIAAFDSRLPAVVERYFSTPTLHATTNPMVALSRDDAAVIEDEGDTWSGVDAADDLGWDVEPPGRADPQVRHQHRPDEDGSSPARCPCRRRGVTG